MKAFQNSAKKKRILMMIFQKIKGIEMKAFQNCAKNKIEFRWWLFKKKGESRWWISKSYQKEKRIQMMAFQNVSKRKENPSNRISKLCLMKWESGWRHFKIVPKEKKIIQITTSQDKIMLKRKENPDDDFSKRKENPDDGISKSC